MAGERGCRTCWSVLAVTIALMGSATAEAVITPRAIIIVPFDASSLAAEDQWIGEGVAQLLSLGLAWHPGFIQIDRRRLGHVGEVWNEALVRQAAQGLHASAAVYGRASRVNDQLVIQPLLLDLDAGKSRVLASMTMAADELLTQVTALPAVYANALGLSLTPAETVKIVRAMRPTISHRALEFYVGGQMALYRGAPQDAVDAFLRSVDVDPNFVVAQYALGVAHQGLGNRWKAAAQFRAATLLDPTLPEPFKAFGDLFLGAPRKLHDQAGEAYAKAIELRPFYADAYVGLGRARAAKGDLDAARTAFEKAVTFDPFNSAAFAELGPIYGAEGRCADSIKAYQRAFELDGQAPGSREACGGPDYF